MNNLSVVIVSIINMIKIWCLNKHSDGMTPSEVIRFLICIIHGPSFMHITHLTIMHNSSDGPFNFLDLKNLKDDMHNSSNDLFFMHSSSEGPFVCIIHQMVSPTCMIYQMILLLTCIIHQTSSCRSTVIFSFISSDEISCWGGGEGGKKVTSQCRSWGVS